MMHPVGRPLNLTWTTHMLVVASAIPIDLGAGSFPNTVIGAVPNLPQIGGVACCPPSPISPDPSPAALRRRPLPINTRGRGRTPVAEPANSCTRFFYISITSRATGIIIADVSNYFHPHELVHNIMVYTRVQQAKIGHGYHCTIHRLLSSIRSDYTKVPPSSLYISSDSMHIPPQPITKT